MWNILTVTQHPNCLEICAFNHKIDYVKMFRRFLKLKAIKMAWLGQEIWQFCCMGGCCLFVELHQEGYAPAAYAVCWFSLHIERKNTFGIFLKPWVKQKFITRIGLGKQKPILCFAFDFFVTMVWNLKIFNWEPNKLVVFFFFKCFLVSPFFFEILSTMPTQSTWIWYEFFYCL